MFTRGAASSKHTEQIKNDFNEHCHFCILSFPTKASRNAHIYTHFKKKDCSKTGKTLLCIADDWFELHECSDHKQLNYEIISDAVHINIDSNDQLIKEESDLENNLARIVEINIKDEIDNETEINFDSMSSTSSERTVASKVTKFRSRTKKVNLNNTSFQIKRISKNTRPVNAKRKKVPSSKTKTLNEKSSTMKPTNQSAELLIKCKICKQKVSKQRLVEHLQLRHVPRVREIPKCEICGKTFSTPGNLRSHQYLHAERGRYICSYCGKDFVRNINLKEHINLHTGARPFVCEICKKTFHRETLLINHRRIHTGEKKYRCNIEDCERAYTFDIDLKRHKFSAHGIYSKKHPCFICSKIFSENKLLKKHLETHS